MRDECSISKKISDNRITFMFLPGHSSRSGNQEAIFPGVNTDCIDHDCNHPGEYHTHD